MGPNTARGPSHVAVGAFVIAGILAAIAVYNYATGVHGGAIVTSIGTVVAALLGALIE
ncbi:hypothetical protein [Haloarcula marina]|uniref:hypothetical protein n=1 Tax=Haloarcula marina TaxID=2961574 RepID=UPI0020B8ABE2|nr:hypothetical protein [Halomicroarcula marina]